MEPKTFHWYKVANAVEDFGFGKYDIIQMEIPGRSICIALHNEKLFAFQALCPHAGVKMVNGYIDMQGNVVCPKHRFKFSMKNGFNVSGEGYNMRTYPVEIREDGVYVGCRL